MRLLHFQRWALPLGLVLLTLIPLQAQERRDPDINRITSERIPKDFPFEDHIVFKTVKDQPLELTFFPPLKKVWEKAPLVVFIHGGGWSHGNRFGITAPNIMTVIRDLSEQGIACATVQYRLVEPDKTTAMDAAADCIDAVAFLAANAERFGLNPDRIATFGGSAGAHLALVTSLGKPADYPCEIALSSPPVRIKCVVAYNPQTSIVDPALREGSHFTRDSKMRGFLGGSLEEKQSDAEKLSPTVLVQPDSPPIFLAHGDSDTVLNVVNSTTLAALAEKQGVPVECLIIEGAEHGFRGATDDKLEEVKKRTVDFFLRYLTPSGQPSGSTPN